MAPVDPDRTVRTSLDRSDEVDGDRTETTARTVRRRDGDGGDSGYGEAAVVPARAVDREAPRGPDPGGDGAASEVEEDDDDTDGAGEELATRFLPVGPTGLPLSLVVVVFAGGLAAMAAAALWSSRRQRMVETATSGPVP